jgi:uncharacterized protein (TIGR00369 family)
LRLVESRFSPFTIVVDTVIGEGVIRLPQTAGCVVCGRSNPHGLKLDLHADPAAGIVRVDFTPAAHHMGFEGIVHGGVLATVFDEAMVWAATWHGKRFCVCAEMNVRFRRSARVGQAVVMTAQVSERRGRFISTAAELTDAAGPLATATGKYMQIPPEEHKRLCDTLVDDPATAEAAELLRRG